MKNLYQIARDGWMHETAGRDPFSYAEPEWEQYAEHRDVERSYLRSLDVVMVAKGGARVTVNGDVGEGAIVLCIGGGATVEVFGNIGKDVRILAAGGSAEIIHHGEVDPSARLVARGGGAKVTKVVFEPKTVLDVQIIVDPAQVGSVTPYRVVVNGVTSSPVDLSDAEREIRYAIAGPAQTAGVKYIEKIRQARR